MTPKRQIVAFVPHPPSAASTCTLAHESGSPAGTFTVIPLVVISHLDHRAGDIEEKRGK